MLTTPRRWLRALYDWTLHWAESSQALTALFLIALIESSVFPIPPDVLLIAIVTARPQAWLRAAAVCTAGSAIGAVVGYTIGAGFMATIGQRIVDVYGAQASWDRVVELYNGTWGLWFLAGAAFTPIPFKVATIAAGATQMSFVPFIVVGTIGRAGRFVLVSAMLRVCGPEVRRRLEANFDMAALLFFVLLVGGFLVLRAL
ncbi:MAG: DedA family protein [Acidobacteria bacterium]|nr:DedA family protein [Acidobacteriota bacterium]